MDRTERLARLNTLVNEYADLAYPDVDVAKTLTTPNLSVALDEIAEKAIEVTEEVIKLGLARQPGTFEERIRDAAMDRMRAEGVLRRHLLEVLRLDQDDLMGEVTSLDEGSHVVGITTRGERRWTTVYDGRADRVWFTGVDMAMLHLISRRHGATDDMGAGATYAARVLQVPTH